MCLFLRICRNHLPPTSLTCTNRVMEYGLLFFPLLVLLLAKSAQGQTTEDVVQIFSDCHYGKSNFDSCIKRAFNNLRPFFKTGIPELNIAPFDPHMAPYVEQLRGDSRGLAGYRLLLSNVSEFGWTNSEVTDYKTDADNNKIVYSQYFPEKSLKGYYEFKSKAVGAPFQTQGFWNLVLYKYSQTTTVTRVAGPGSLLKVRVEIDNIGDLKLHINNYLGGKPVLGECGWIVMKSIRNYYVVLSFLQKKSETFSLTTCGS